MTLIEDEVKEFLSRVPPFGFLDERTLGGLARSVSIEYFPRGTRILTEGGSPSIYLSVIKKGGVKVFNTSAEGEETGVEIRGEGDSFGFVSLIGGDKARSNVVAVEDTICYQVGRDSVLRLLESAPAFTEYYLKSFLIKSIDRTHDELRRRSALYGSSDRLLFTTKVGDLATKDVVGAGQEVSIREAAAVMAEHGTSSLILFDEGSLPVGIVTDRDLRSKVVAKGRDASGPVKEIMSRSLVRVDADDFCFEALLKMVRYGIHHLLVVEGGRLKGVITNHEFMLLQGISPVSVVRDIESRHTVEGLRSAAAGVDRLVALLLKEGARAGNITRIISEINDRLVRQAIEMAVRKLGAPPVPFCWVAFGSEGRKEQTFKTDQDNAIIHADPADAGEAAAAGEYFGRLSASVVGALAECGFPPCPAGYMATNPLWRQGLRAWKDRFRKWIYNPTPDAVLSSLIFFDFRPVWGDASLAEGLRDSLSSMIADQPVFLGFMAREIIRNRPPIGFFKKFVVEKDGEHKDQLNLKVKGISPLVDIARLFALEKGVRATSTSERLRELRAINSIIGERAEEFEQAFEFLMLLRIHHQMGQKESGIEPDNFIDPDRLSNLEKKAVKEAFLLVSGMQELIIERYRAMIW